MIETGVGSETWRSLVNGRDYIPKDGYISAEFARLEAEKLWPHVWQVACRAEQLPEVGDYLEYSIADQSILLTRTGPDTIKAFFNTCLHRGAQLRDGCGTQKEIRCPYHGWRWNLDGSIRDIPCVEDFPAECVRPEDLHLAECQVALWGGFVFINMDPDAAPLMDYLGSVAGRLERLHLEDMRLTRYRTAILPANWKTALDSFSETYHAQTVHAQTMRYIDWTYWIYENFGPHGCFRPDPGAIGRADPRLGYEPDRREMMLEMADDVAGIDLVDHDTLEGLVDMAMDIDEDISLTTILASMYRMLSDSEGLDLSGFEDHELFVEDWTIFPTITGGLNPVSCFIFRVRPNGLDPESCIFDQWGLTRVGEGREIPKVEHEVYGHWRECDAWDRVLMQDLTIISQLQKGLHSRRFDRLLCGRQERNLKGMNRELMRFLTAPDPTPGANGHGANGSG